MVQKIKRTAEDREKRLFWERHFEQWEKCGMSQLGYCRNNGLKHHQFMYWRKKLQLAEEKSELKIIKIPTAKPLQMQDRKLNQSNYDGKGFHFSVNFPNGYCISLKENFSSSEFKRLIFTLESLHQ